VAPTYDCGVTTTLDTRLKIASWDELTLDQFADASKLTRADVTLSEGADGLDSGSFHSVMYYRPDGTSEYTTLMRLDATLSGRRGSFALIGEGTFDGAAAVARLRIIEGSGTGELAGITGECTSASTHDDYPFMPLSLTYVVG
jgi:hypothetical protein